MKRFGLLCFFACWLVNPLPALYGAPEKEPLSGNEVRFRFRVTKMKPDQPVRVMWRYGGEGLGGKPVVGELTARLPDRPKMEETALSTSKKIEDVQLENKNPDIVEDGVYIYTYLRANAWAEYHSIYIFGKHRGNLIVTLTLQGRNTGASLKDTEIEFEFVHNEKLLKRFTIEGSDGPTFGLVVPYYGLSETGEPTPAFVRGLGSLRAHVETKLEDLRALPWTSLPAPRLYGILTDCSGYGEGAGYGVRTSDKATMLAEYEVLKLMGFNGLRGSVDFFVEMIKKREGLGADFTRICERSVGGYPIPMVRMADGKMPERHPGDGCPFHPQNKTDRAKEFAEQAEAALQNAKNLGVDALWGLTVDEIGNVFGGAPEGSAHPGCCPYCQEAFREFVRSEGRTLEEFGAPSWDDIRPQNGYWTRNYWDCLNVLTQQLQEAEAAMANAADRSQTTLKSGRQKDALDAILEDTFSKGDKPKIDPAKQLLEARARLDNLLWKTQLITIPKEEQKHRLSPAGWNLLGYYSTLFMARASGQAFEPMQKAFAAVNAPKKPAIEQGRPDSPEAKQPRVYCFALRGNTFLMGGGSLDFFDFYRFADTAFVYETSNRDPRVWEWDSYLCDVGRTLSLRMDKEFGIYVKPHRGAPIQRAFTAAARGARMIFWYTYGPEWWKGDGFAGRAEDRKDVAWANRMLGAAENVMYEADWAFPAEVAVVRPRASEVFQNSASLENGKWVYQALTHAHIPVDALDEGLLMSEDISRYKAIYISGSHLRTDVAARLVKWVEAGGTLYTSGWGLARNESDEPLKAFEPALGLKTRSQPDLWSHVPVYGAVSLGALKSTAQQPPGARVEARSEVAGSFDLAVGRETLAPADGTEVLATYADGGAAMTRHRHGKGMVYVCGFYAGVEYSADILKDGYDMAGDFSADKRSFIVKPALNAGVKPVVDASHPLVEGVLLRNPKTGAMAVVLMNWAYKPSGLIAQSNVTVNVRVPAVVISARSLALAQSLKPVEAGQGVVSLALPIINEGEILLLNAGDIPELQARPDARPARKK